MQREKRRVMLSAVIIGILVLSTAVIYRFWSPADPGVGMLQFWLTGAVYFAVPVYWSVSVRRRVIHRRIRSCLWGMTLCLMAHIVLRSLKYKAFSDILPWSRWLWYAYYIPMLLVPLFSYFAILCIGRPETAKLPKRAAAVTVGILLLMAAVLTNDRHGLVFRLEIDPADGSWGGRYRYGPFYFVLLVCMLLLVADIFIRLWKRCQLEHRTRRIVVPMLVLSAVVTAGTVYVVDPLPPWTQTVELSVLFCTGVIAVWESFLQTDLVPMNEQYREFFAASPIAAKIVDEDYHVYYASDSALNVETPVMIHAENGAIPLGGGKRLRSTPISGGHMLWLEDVSDVERMLAELRETGARLAENNELLAAEVDLRRRQAVVAEQNRLYDRITTEMQAEFRSLDWLLEARAEESAKDAMDRLAMVCVIGAYVKRRSNLLLIGERENTVAAEEVRLCLRESAEAFSACGADVTLTARAEGNLAKEAAWLAYDLFEAAVETGAARIRVLRIVYEAEDGGMILRLWCVGADFGLPDGWRREEIAALGGALAVTRTPADGEREAQTALTFRLDRYGRLDEEGGGA